jgi:hypothetical protein
VDHYPNAHSIERPRALPIPNETYAGIKLLYTPSLAEPAFQEVGGLSRVMERTWRATRFALAAELLFAVIWVPLLFVYVGFVLAFLIWVTAWLYGFLRKDHVAIGSWQALGDGMGGAAEAVYARTVQELSDFRRVREAGVVVEPRPADTEGRRVLRVRHGTYSVLCAVVPFGADLHMSWTMVQSRSGVDAIGEFFRFMGRDWFAREVASSGPKALRDAVHHSLNNGLSFAAAGGAVRRADVAPPAAGPTRATTSTPDIDLTSPAFPPPGEGAEPAPDPLDQPGRRPPRRTGPARTARTAGPVEPRSRRGETAAE